MVLGVEVELDKLFMKSSIKELTILKQQRDAMVRLTHIQKENEDLEKTIENL